LSKIANFRNVLNDCSLAIKNNPKNIKAYCRSSKALYALDRVDEGIDCCEKGLLIDPKNLVLKSELKKLQEKKVRLVLLLLISKVEFRFIGKKTYRA
jgi:tetratricopeptide (TPR) repeat protein